MHFTDNLKNLPASNNNSFGYTTAADDAAEATFREQIRFGFTNKRSLEIF